MGRDTGDWTDQEPAPEDFLPATPKTRTAIYQKPRLKSAIPAVLFLAFAFSMSVLVWRSLGRMRLGISHELFFDGGEYWRGVTALLVHSDMAHFLSNSWLVFLFGWFLRDLAGLWAFPLLSVCLGFLTNVLTVMTMPAKTMLIGASGMAYGMVGFWLVLYVGLAEGSLARRLMGAIGFVLIILFPTTFRPEVSYMAHGIGFGLGLAGGIGFYMIERQKWLPAENGNN